jgi:hypothetical protein
VSHEPTDAAPYGYDVYTHTEVVPKQAPIRWRWNIGPVTIKSSEPIPRQQPPVRTFTQESEVNMQLTADQQVELSISGEDAYGNAVDISGDVAWTSSDESIVAVTQNSSDKATAAAVGPVGNATVTVTNDVDSDGSGDFIGSIAINVVAGKMADIEVTAAEPTDKP